MFFFYDCLKLKKKTVNFISEMFMTKSLSYDVRQVLFLYVLDLLYAFNTVSELCNFVTLVCNVKFI